MDEVASLLQYRFPCAVSEGFHVLSVKVCMGAEFCSLLNSLAILYHLSKCACTFGNCNNYNYMLIYT